jgi:uncharacterized membrane protein YidH (DUF202 family)
MNSSTQWLTIFGRFFLVLLLQVLIMDQVMLFGFVNPLLYCYFILLFPLSGSRIWLLILSFILGLGVDIFNNTGGAHAAASVFLAWIRPALLNFSFGVSYQYNTVKIVNAPLGQQLIFVISAVLLHHLVLFSLEAGSWTYWVLILKSTLITTLISAVIILSAFQFFNRNNT